MLRIFRCIRTGNARRCARESEEKPMSPQPVDTLKGFGVTFKQIFKKPLTQQYPEFKRPVYPRFRGRHRLWRHENGLEKSVCCPLYAAAWPAHFIRLVAA